jgi:hypothetical protein
MQSPARSLALAFAVATATSSSFRPAFAAPTEVTSCGQVVTGRANLVGDLNCTGAPNPDAAVVLEAGSQLALSGFTIRGNVVGVLANGKARIVGPGTITDAVHGIDAKGTLDLRGVDVVGNSDLGVQCFASCRVRGPAALSNNGTPGGFPGTASAPSGSSASTA